MNMLTPAKIMPEHLQRRAIVYVPVSGETGGATIDCCWA